MDSAQISILIIDDEPLLRDIFEEWLQEEGYRVLTASCGVVALKVMEAQKVDVILTDVRMPGMDGLALLKSLKTSGRHLPKAILVSGYNDVSLRDAYDLGVESILQKPMERDELMGALRKSLKPREQVWRSNGASRAPQLHASLPEVSAALEQGYLAFGRGGFCLQSRAAHREGPVRFGLEFAAGPTVMAGDGFIRWVQTDEGLLGVEIASLDGECYGWASHLIETRAQPSYIPRSVFHRP